jgi:hypothetical protein
MLLDLRILTNLKTLIKSKMMAKIQLKALTMEKMELALETLSILMASKVLLTKLKSSS